jgi:hypothetical protein
MFLLEYISTNLLPALVTVWQSVRVGVIQLRMELGTSQMDDERSL